MSPARKQALAAVVAAAAVIGAWAILGTGLRVRWLVSRGSPPAPPAQAAEAALGLQAVGADALPHLLDVVRDEGAPRGRKAWVASVLLRAPFFARPQVEALLASPHAPTARAAAFALLDGFDAAANFEEAASGAEMPRAVAAPKAPLVPWDPAPAIPVLVAWVADRADPEARLAAMLLGRIPPGDLRVRDALLAVVEEVPSLYAEGDAPGAVLRKMAVVSSLQGLLAWARNDPEVAGRVARMVAWVQENGKADTGWDLQQYGLRLFEVARGRGVDPSLLRALARSTNTVVRQRLCGTLEVTPGEESSRILQDLAGDESPPVRRAVVKALRMRKDPLLVRLAPYLVEDPYPYVRADTVLSLGELLPVAPEACRAAVPLLVSCLEEPWQGKVAEEGSAYASFMAGARAAVVEGAALSLHKITGRVHGFEDGALVDFRKREEAARTLATDDARRAKVVEAWRTTVPRRPDSERVPHLVARLEDRDMDSVLRAVRELRRITGRDDGFPPEAFDASKDDTTVRNILREMRKKGAWEPVVARWK